MVTGKKKAESDGHRRSMAPVWVSLTLTHYKRQPVGFESAEFCQVASGFCLCCQRYLHLDRQPRRGACAHCAGVSGGIDDAARRTWGCKLQAMAQHGSRQGSPVRGCSSRLTDRRNRGHPYCPAVDLAALAWRGGASRGVSPRGRLRKSSWVTPQSDHARYAPGKGRRMH